MCLILLLKRGELFNLVKITMGRGSNVQTALSPGRAEPRPPCLDCPLRHNTPCPRNCASLTPCSIHITIKEQLSLTLQRDGGLDAFELKGDLDLRVSDADKAKLRVTLASEDYSNLQFKQHPNVAKFAASGDKVIQLKDASRSFPVGQGLGVLRWRMTGKDESWVPLTGMYLMFRACCVLPGRVEKVGRERMQGERRDTIGGPGSREGRPRERAM